jgi:ParB family transcriptional regulator, chromosome partitioning protein
VLGTHLKVSMADYWDADPAFFDLLRDREVATVILAEVGGSTTAQANADQKLKTIKSVINDHLRGENGRTKFDAWIPCWMAFPPSTYTSRGGVAMVAAAERAKWLAEEGDVGLDADSTPVSAPEGDGASCGVRGEGGDGEANTNADTNTITDADTNTAEAFAEADAERLAA